VPWAARGRSPSRFARPGSTSSAWAFDIAPLGRLHRLARDWSPDVIHAWQPLALRAAGLLPACRAKRLIVSVPCRFQQRGMTIGRLDRWLLGRAERVAVFGPSEAAWCQKAGIGETKLWRVRPAVAANALDGEPPKLGRGIACVGPLEPHKGFRDALWAFDILRTVVPEAEITLIGDGSDRPRLAKFIHDSQTGAQVHLLGPQTDVPALLARSALVWVPSLAPAGVNAALEGMAAGLPVVASRLPELAEAVVNGETGFLVPAGDKVALVRQTRWLLDHDAARRRMGEAARRHVAERFSVGDMVRRFGEMYDAPV
jgi:glycosyltransferase involved in cell wall biosynthesis